jgi:hypothetical protein
LGRFLKITEGAQILGLHFSAMYQLCITTNGLGYTLGYFFLPHLVTLKLTSGQKKSFSGQSGGDPHGGRARTVQVVRSFLPKQ